MAERTRGRTIGRDRTEPRAKPRNDAYTGLLFLSFLAMAASCVLLYLDYDQYGDAKPPKANADLFRDVAPPPKFETKPEEKPEEKPEDNKPEDKKPEDKKPEDKKPEGGASLPMPTVAQASHRSSTAVEPPPASLPLDLPIVQPVSATLATQPPSVPGQGFRMPTQ